MGTDYPDRVETLVRNNVLVQMRDGVHLGTDIYFPAMPYGNQDANPGFFPSVQHETLQVLEGYVSRHSGAHAV